MTRAQQIAEIATQMHVADQRGASFGGGDFRALRALEWYVVRAALLIEAAEQEVERRDEHESAF